MKYNTANILCRNSSVKIQIDIIKIVRIQCVNNNCNYHSFDINNICFTEWFVIDPEAKARASGNEREMGQARARENFSRSEREK